MAALRPDEFPKAALTAASRGRGGRDSPRHALWALLLLPLVEESKRAFRAVSAASAGAAPPGRPSAAYRAIKRLGVRKGMAAEKGKAANSIEALVREEADGGALENARDGQEFFWLVSEHGDCAEDHEAWQGRLYVDSGWRSRAKDPDAVKAAIAKRGCRTLQAAEGRPTWLLTRPNCRHYAASIPTSEALSDKSVGEMLRERGMVHAVGPRGGRQALRHSTAAGWYTRRNVESIIERYEERYDEQREMLALRPCEELERDLGKTRLMLEKWKAYLRKSFG